MAILLKINDSKVTPPLVPLTRFWPAAGLSMTIASTAFGVTNAKVVICETITGSSPVKVIVEPSIYTTPSPFVVALGV